MTNRVEKGIRECLGAVLDHPLTRRGFIKTTGAVAGTVAASSSLVGGGAKTAAAATPDLTEISDGVQVRYSVCLGCHSKCGIQVRVKDDTIVKIDGNPWHPNNAETGDRLPFDAPLDAGLVKPGTLCPKGQAGVEVMYNPFRIKQPLRRVGARGSGQWEAISWDQALTEIAEKIRPLWQGYADGIHIDGQPALGTIANQLAFSPGRLQHGQKEFTDRLFKKGFGTVNARHDHTSICETTHHVAGDFLAERKKHHFKPDVLHAEYILWFGTNPLEANFPTQTLAKRLAKSTGTGTKHVIIDPRHSNSARFAHRWLPVRPGADTALAMGIARRILDTGAHDVSFLEPANNQAALATTDWDGVSKDKQYNTTDATYLVVVDGPSEEDRWIYHRIDGAYSVIDASTGDAVALDRGADAPARWGRLGLSGSETGAVLASDVGLQGVGEYVVDLGDGRYGAPVFQLYAARVRARSLDEYAATCGIDAATIAAVADEFAAGGRRAVATAYRGACQKTAGMSTMQAILVLNHLVGNWDWKGGCLGATGGHLHEMGGKADGQLGLSGQAATARSPSGPQLTRVKTFFDSELAAALGESFDAPTRRQWFPWAYNGNYQEVLPSAGSRYPYPLKALFSYWNNVVYSAPAAKETSYQILSDETRVPLHVCFDIEMGEMASLADYVLPDGSYLERWSTPHNAPTILSKLSCFRSPVVGYYAQKGYWEALEAGTLDQWTYEIDWANDEGPFTLEDITLELMRRVAGGSLDAVPALGTQAYYPTHADMVADGVSPAMRNELRTAWDWYWNVLVNFAIEAGVAPNDTAAIHDMVHQIVERGGWFQDTTDAAGNVINEYDGDYVKSRLAIAKAEKALHFFFEYRYPDDHADRPGKRYLDPYSRKPYDPLPDVLPVLDAKGNPVEDGLEFPFKSVTYHPMHHSQSRTDSLPSLTALEAENFLEMNTADARALGLWTGDLVRVTSASNTVGVKGRLKATERIRPGVIAVSHSRGRWEINSRAYKVDGKNTPVATRRGKGITTNPVLRLDPTLGDVTLQEPIGGSAAFYDTTVKIEKVLG